MKDEKCRIGRSRGDGGDGDCGWGIFKSQRYYSLEQNSFWLNVLACPLTQVILVLMKLEFSLSCVRFADVFMQIDRYVQVGRQVDRQVLGSQVVRQVGRLGCITCEMCRDGWLVGQDDGTTTRRTSKVLSSLLKYITAFLLKSLKESVSQPKETTRECEYVGSSVGNCVGRYGGVVGGEQG